MFERYLPVEIFEQIVVNSDNVAEIHDAYPQMFNARFEYLLLLRGVEFVPNYTSYFARLNNRGVKFSRETWTRAYMNPKTRRVAREMLRHGLVETTVADYLVIVPTIREDYELLNRTNPVGDIDLISIVSDYLPIDDVIMTEIFGESFSHHRQDIYRHDITNSREKPSATLDQYTAIRMLIDAVHGRPFLYNNRLRNPYTILKFVSEPLEVYMQVLSQLSHPQYQVNGSLVPSNWLTTLMSMSPSYSLLNEAIQNGIQTPEQAEMVHYMYFNYTHLLPSDTIIKLLEIDRQISPVPALNHPSPNVVQAALRHHTLEEVERQSIIPCSLGSLNVLLTHGLKPEMINLSTLLTMAVNQTKRYIESKKVDLWFSDTTIPPSLELPHVVEQIVMTFPDIVSMPTTIIANIVGLPLTLFKMVLSRYTRRPHSTEFPVNGYVIVSKWSNDLPMNYEMTYPCNQLKLMMERQLMHADYDRYIELDEYEHEEEDYDY